MIARGRNQCQSPISQNIEYQKLYFVLRWVLELKKSKKKFFSSSLARGRNISQANALQCQSPISQDIEYQKSY